MSGGPRVTLASITITVGGIVIFKSFIGSIYVKVKEKVHTKNLTSNTPKWIAGTVTKVTRPLSYIIQLEDRRILRDHVKKRAVIPGVSTDFTLELPDTTLESLAPPPQDTSDANVNASQKNEPDSSADELIVDLTQPH